MPEIKTIHIPGHWESPKYNLGQLVNQVQIIGMEYHPLETALERKYGGGWFYFVMPDTLEESTEVIKESAIQLPTPEELQAEIDSLTVLIEACQSNIHTLTQQLEQAQQ